MCMPVEHNIYNPWTRDSWTTAVVAAPHVYAYKNTEVLLALYSESHVSIGGSHQSIIDTEMSLETVVSYKIQCHETWSFI